MDKQMVISQEAYNGLGSQGVQPWSVGGIYPFIVQGVQASPDAPIKYGILKPSGEFQLAGSCDNAIKLGAMLKAQENKPLDMERVDACVRVLIRRDQRVSLSPAAVSEYAQKALDEGDGEKVEAAMRFAKYRFMVEA